MKKLLSVLLVSLLLVGMISIASAADVEVTLFNNKVEIETTLQAFAQQYSDATPGVTVTVETSGGGVDYQGVLKSKHAADQLPVIFVIEGQGNYDLWKDYIADMSGAAWLADTDMAYYAPDGTAVGFPVSVEGYGLGYNADILAKAGIDPATLTTFSAVKAAFEKAGRHESRARAGQRRILRHQLRRAVVGHRAARVQRLLCRIPGLQRHHRDQ